MFSRVSHVHRSGAEKRREMSSGHPGLLATIATAAPIGSHAGCAVPRKTGAAYMSLPRCGGVLVRYEPKGRIYI